MNRKFKKGDIVKVIKNTRGDKHDLKLGTLMEVRYYQRRNKTYKKAMYNCYNCIVINNRYKDNEFMYVYEIKKVTKKELAIYDLKQ